MIMTETILQFLNGIPAELSVIIISLTPVIELRGALPVALGVYKMQWMEAFPLVILGNMLPGFLIIFGWDWFVELLGKHWPWLNRLLEKRYQKMQVQWDEKIEKYGPWALVLFVAIPLPGSGVWSGSLVAWIFGISQPRALLAVFIGAVLSGLIVTALTLGGMSIF